MPEQTPDVGRLALRQEGDWWVAYYAASDTMTNAVKIGTIHMAGVSNHPERKQMFLDLMQHFIGGMIENMMGVAPHWDTARTAPDHERMGRKGVARS